MKSFIANKLKFLVIPILIMLAATMMGVLGYKEKSPSNFLVAQQQVVEDDNSTSDSSPGEIEKVEQENLGATPTLTINNKYVTIVSNGNEKTSDKNGYLNYSPISAQWTFTTNQMYNNNTYNLTVEIKNLTNKPVAITNIEMWGKNGVYTYAGDSGPKGVTIDRKPSVRIYAQELSAKASFTNYYMTLTLSGFTTTASMDVYLKVEVLYQEEDILLDSVELVSSNGGLINTSSASSYVSVGYSINDCGAFVTTNGTVDLSASVDWDNLNKCVAKTHTFSSARAQVYYSDGSGGYTRDASFSFNNTNGTYADTTNIQTLLSYISGAKVVITFTLTTVPRITINTTVTKGTYVSSASWSGTPSWTTGFTMNLPLSSLNWTLNSNTTTYEYSFLNIVISCNGVTTTLESKTNTTIAFDEDNLSGLTSITVTITVNGQRTKIEQEETPPTRGTVTVVSGLSGRSNDDVYYSDSKYPKFNSTGTTFYLYLEELVHTNAGYKFASLNYAVVGDNNADIASGTEYAIFVTGKSGVQFHDVLGITEFKGARTLNITITVYFTQIIVNKQNITKDSGIYSVSSTTGYSWEWGESSSTVNTLYITGSATITPAANYKFDKFTITLKSSTTATTNLYSNTYDASYWKTAQTIDLSTKLKDVSTVYIYISIKSAANGSGGGSGGTTGISVTINYSNCTISGGHNIRQHETDSKAFRIDTTGINVTPNSGYEFVGYTIIAYNQAGQQKSVLITNTLNRWESTWLFSGFDEEVSNFSIVITLNVKDYFNYTSVAGTGGYSIAAGVNFGDFFTDSGNTGGALDFSNPAVTGGSTWDPVNETYTDGKTIVAITASGFINQTGIKTLTIPASVTTIGEAAFLNCTGLTTINYNATNVTSTNRNIFNISGTTPENNTGTITFNVGENVQSIPGYLFYAGSGYYNKLNSVIFTTGSACTTIGAYAFSGCSQLTSVTFEGTSSLTSIGYYAFNSCSALTSITIPSRVTTIGSYAFNSCSALTSITIPSSVTTIGSYAFNSCSALTSITIPASVTTIDAYAFLNSGLTSVTFVKKAIWKAGSTEIKESSLTDTRAATLLKTTYKSSTWTRTPQDFKYVSVTGGYSIAAGADFDAYISSNSGTLIIPSNYNSNSVITIAANGFAGETGITTLIIPASVTTIGANAFLNSGLTSVTFENYDGWTVKSESTETTLTETDLRSYAVGYLKSSYVGYTWTWAEAKEYFVFEEINDMLNGMTFDGLGIKAGKDFADWTGTEIPSVDDEGNSVSAILADGFKGKTHSNTSLTIQSGIIWIKDSAFEGCTWLTSVTIPASVTTIGAYAFQNTGLTSATFAHKTWEINNGTTTRKVDISYLSSVDLVNVLKSTYVAYGWTKITAVKYFNFEEIARVTDSGAVGYSIAAGDDFADYLAILGTSITIPTRYNSLNVIRIKENGFYGTGIVSVTIPSSIVMIEANAFSGCSSLTDVTFNNTEVWTKITDGTPITDLSNSETAADHLTGDYKGFTWIRIMYEDLDAFVFDSGNLVSGSNFESYIDHYSGILVIPQTWRDGEGVSTIVTDPDFMGNEYIKELIIPEGVTYLDEAAFGGCNNLTKITLPASLETIYCSFCYCPITEIIDNIGNDPEETNKYWVNSYDETEYVPYNDLIDVLYDWCERWIVIIRGEGPANNFSYILNTHEDFNGTPFAFDSLGVTGWVVSLSNFSDPNINILDTYNDGTEEYNVIAIMGGNETASGFAGTTITSLTLGTNIIYIGSYAFYNCASLTSVTFNDRLKTIGDSAFEGCTELESVTIPASVETIGAKAFLNSGLTSATFEHLMWKIMESSGTYAYNVGAVSADVRASALTFDWAYGTGVWTKKEFFKYAGTSIEAGDDFDEFIGIKKGVLDLTSNDVHGGNTIVTIKASGFTGKTGITTLKISGTVTSIGTYAFQNCSSLTTVNLSSARSLQSIGSQAFFECSSLATVNLSSASVLTTIGEYVFYNCTSLTSITIPARVTSIGNDAFQNCSNLTTVNLSSASSLTTIGEFAFHNCTSLTSITIPAKVTSIGKGVFRDCSSLATVNLSSASSLTTIGEFAFYNCTSLTSIEIPETVTEIQASAFRTCSSLATANLSSASSLTTIGEYAFSNCSALTSITIPETVTEIQAHAFRTCTALAEITFEEGSLLENIGTHVFLECSLLESIEIPAGVTIISNYLFYKCSSLTSIEFLGNVTTIGTNAFYYCTSLTSITIPASVTTINTQAFNGCNNLSSAYFEHNNWQVSNGTTTEDIDIIIRSLTEADMATYLKSTYVAYSWTKIATVEYFEYAEVRDEEGTLLGYSIKAGDYFGTYIEQTSGALDFSSMNHGGKTIVAIKASGFERITDITSVTIPASITSIEGRAFAYCKELETVDFEGTSQLESIGEWAFFDCEALSSITIPASVTSIGVRAFAYCKVLASVTFEGTSELEIGNNAFYACYKLTSITIPARVTSIGVCAFNACSLLTEITVDDSNTKYSSEDGILFNKEKTTLICCPAGKTGEYTVPSTVKTIGEYAFESSKITKIIIAGSVNYIGVYAFTGVSLDSAMFGDPAGWQYVNADGTIVEISYANAVSSAVSILQDDRAKSKELTIFSYILNTDTQFEGTPFDPDNLGAEGWVIDLAVGDVTEISIGAMYSGINIIAIMGGDSTDSSGFAETGITSLSLGANIIYIGSYAFYECKNLNSVTLNDGLVTIGQFAFHGCPSLTEIVLPASVKTIENSAFMKCIGVQTLTINDGLETIGNNAFRYCIALTEAIIPSSVTTIGDHAFYLCEAIEEITIGDIVTSVSEAKTTIGKYAFAFLNNTAVKTITIGNCVKSIGTYAFNRSSLAETLTIGENVESIGAYAFFGFEKCLTLNYNANVAYLTFDGTDTGLDEFDNSNNNNHIFSRLGQSAAADDDVGVTINIGSNVTKLPNNMFFSTQADNNIKIASINWGEASYEADGKTLKNPLEIGTNAFIRVSGLISINLGDRVTKIGNNAFWGCENLDSIELGTAVAEIGVNAFRNCSKLTEVVIPESVKTISDYAFYICTGLTEINIKGNFDGSNPQTSIGLYAFANCSAVTTLTIGKGVETINRYAFYGLTNCKTLYFNAIAMSDLSSAYNVENPQANEVFYNLGAGLIYSTDGDLGTTLEVGNKVTKIPNNLFCVSKNNVNIITINWGEGVDLTIGTNAFRGCLGLQEVEIGTNRNTYIGENAFRYCINIKKLTIGQNVKNIAPFAFYDLKNCTELIFNAEDMEDMFSEDDEILNKDGETISQNNHTFYNLGTETDGVTVTIGSNVTKIPNNLFYSSNNFGSVNIKSIAWNNTNNLTIGKNAFKGCSNLTETIIDETEYDGLILPSTVTAIGEYAFYFCTGLVAIEIPGSVTTIGERAFNNCTAVTSLDIGEGVETIGIYAFYFCSALTSIVIPNSVTSIGSYAFAYCSAVTTLTIEEGVKTINGSAFYYCSSLEEIKIPNSVTTIGTYVFAYCSAVTKLTIGAGVTTIGNYAFYFCSALTSIVIPNNVTSIGTHAFAHCSKVTTLTIGEGVEKIGYSAFYYCSALTSIVIPDSVTSIGVYAFAYCSAVTTVTIGAGVTTINSCAFYELTNCETLYFNAIAMKDLSSHLDGYSQANDVFYNLGAGKGVTLYVGENVTRIPNNLFFVTENNVNIIKIEWETGKDLLTIGTNAFRGCLGLQEVEIGTNRNTYIGENAFRYCTNIKKLTIGQNVKNIAPFAFYEVINCTELAFNAINMEDMLSKDESSQNNHTFFNLGKESGGVKVTIGSNVTKIPNNLFYSSSNIGVVNITEIIWAEDTENPENNSKTLTIGNKAFKGCSSLTELELPDKVTVIGEHAFEDCSGVVTLTIGKGVEDIGISAFSGLSNCTTFNFNATNAKELDVNTYGSKAFDCMGINTTGTTLNIGEDVEKIPAFLFYNERGYDIVKITTLNWSDNSKCTEIGEYAFSFLQYLAKVTIPDSVTLIKPKAFYGCNKFNTDNGELNLSSNYSWVYSTVGYLFSTDYISTAIVPCTNGNEVAKWYYSMCSDSTTELFYIYPLELFSYTFHNCDTDDTGDDYYSVRAGEFFWDSENDLSDYGITSITIPEEINGILVKEIEGCGWESLPYGGDPVVLNFYYNIQKIGIYAFNGNAISVLNFLDDLGESQLKILEEGALCVPPINILPASLTHIAPGNLNSKYTEEQIKFNIHGWFYTDNSDYTGGESLDPAMFKELEKEYGREFDFYCFLYRDVTPTYEIIFNLKGGNIGGDANNFTAHYYYGGISDGETRWFADEEVNDKFEFKIPTKKVDDTNYTFMGYKTADGKLVIDAGGNAVASFEGFTGPSTDDTDTWVYAEWEAQEVSVNIKIYDSSGEVSKDITITRSTEKQELDLNTKDHSKIEFTIVPVSSDSSGWEFEWCITDIDNKVLNNITGKEYANSLKNLNAGVSKFIAQTAIPSVDGKNVIGISIQVTITKYITIVAENGKVSYGGKVVEDLALTKAKDDYKGITIDANDGYGIYSVEITGGGFAYNITDGINITGGTGYTSLESTENYLNKLVFSLNEVTTDITITITLVPTITLKFDLNTDSIIDSDQKEAEKAISMGVNMMMLDDTGKYLPFTDKPVENSETVMLHKNVLIGLKGVASTEGEIQYAITNITINEISVEKDVNGNKITPTIEIDEYISLTEADYSLEEGKTYNVIYTVKKVIKTSIKTEDKSGASIKVTIDSPIDIKGETYVEEGGKLTIKVEEKQTSAYTFVGFKVANAVIIKGSSYKDLIFDSYDKDKNISTYNAKMSEELSEMKVLVYKHADLSKFATTFNESATITLTHETGLKYTLSGGGIINNNGFANMFYGSYTMTIATSSSVSVTVNDKAETAKDGVYTFTITEEGSGLNVIIG